MLSYFTSKVHRNKRFLVLFLVFAIIFFGASAGYALKQSSVESLEEIADINDNPSQSIDFIHYTSQPFIARSLMLYGQDIMRQESPPPPQISRFYAYISSSFYDIFTLKNSSSNAIFATKEIINTLYPTYKTKTDEVAQALSTEKLPSELYEDEAKALKSLLTRIENDGSDVLFTDKTTDKIGWEEISPDLLVSPNAGSWKRWILDDKIDLQKPSPSSNINTELTSLRKINKEISNAQKNTAKYWHNTDGSIGVSGIWQDRLFDELETNKFDEESFALIQKTLAVGLADATIETWKLKYQYWIPPLVMSYPEIKPLVKTQFTPSFPSETAVLASTAKRILHYYVPEKDTIFLKDAEESRDSGLWAGISLDRDNQSGYELGKQIGLEVIKRSK